MENVEQEERYAGKGIFIFGALVVLLVVCIIAITRNKKTEESGRDIKVLSIDGQATVYRDGEGYKNAYNGMEIISGDVISTGAGSYLSISMDGNKCIMVEPASTIILEAKGDDKHNRTQITVEKGAVISDIREALDEQSSYEVVTDNSIISVRGTIFRTEYNAELMNVKVAVHHGTVECKPYFSNDKVVVECGNEIRFDGNVDDAVISDINYSGYSDKMNDFIAEAEKHKEEHTVDSEEDKQCVVQFIYDGEVFVTKTVDKGDLVNEPVIYPAVEGEWQWDFSEPVMDDISIEWK